jgi:two-component system, OmpR family, KDP operon response regulator KdpE
VADRDPPVRHPERVLVIDDEPTVRRVLSGLLVKAGYTVIVAADGREGLEMVTAGAAPDLIVLDLMMPRMNGFEVLKALRANKDWAQIPVIVLTATPMGNTADMLDVDAMLRKPFDAVDVQAAIYLALESRRKKDEKP